MHARILVKKTINSYEFFLEKFENIGNVCMQNHRFAVSIFTLCDLQIRIQFSRDVCNILQKLPALQTPTDGIKNVDVFELQNKFVQELRASENCWWT